MIIKIVRKVTLVMNKKQLIYSILALFLLGFIVTGGTFAYLSWRSDNNKSVIFNTAKNLEKYMIIFQWTF